MHTLRVQTNAGEGAGDREDGSFTDRVACIGFSLIDAGRLYARRFEQRTRDLALDLTQCRALIVLAQNQGITQQRLAELTTIEPTALGRLVDRLQAHGSVERSPRPGDRRARSLAITPQARVLLPLIWGAITQSQLKALDGLSTSETLILMKALDRVLANLQLSGRTGG
jgi:MarR family transcriptional regulator, transcriptional regulator for hemolysin